MTKQEKILWVILPVVLVILFLLSSTDLIIKEKKTVIYPISIIISDTSDDYFANFRKGADKAAEEYNVDVSFITLYEKGDQDQQLELVKREINDGALAVVLVPVKPEECAKKMDDMEETFRKAIEGLVYPGSEKVIIAAIDTKSLDETAEIIAGSPVYGSYVDGLYGVGSTTRLLTDLDNGVIKGLVVSDQFDAGYRSIEKAVESVHRGFQKEQIVLDSYYIRREDLRESKYEKILYPID